MKDCWCEPYYENGQSIPYHQGIGNVFGDCVYTNTHMWAFAIGILSLVGFIVAQLPQLWQNYKAKKVEGLSFTFLAVWLAGDITNFLGVVLTSANANQLIISVYFLLMDVLMLGQWYYYYRKTKIQLVAGTEPLQQVVVDDRKVQTYNMNTIALIACFVIAALASSTININAPGLLAELPAGMEKCEKDPPSSQAVRTLGSIFAWCSGLLYFFSRIPQLVTNEKRRSTEGVSAVMFLIMLSSNVAYGLTIILRPFDASGAEFWTDKFPYLLGSMGTLVFDIYFQIQVYRFRNNKV